MLFLGLDQDDPAWRALPAGAPAHEILHTTIGDADQPVIVAVKIIGVPGKAGPDGFDARGGIMHQTDTVRQRCHLRGSRGRTGSCSGPVCAAAQTSSFMPMLRVATVAFSQSGRSGGPFIKFLLLCAIQQDTRVASAALASARFQHIANRTTRLAVRLPTQVPTMLPPLLPAQPLWRMLSRQARELPGANRHLCSLVHYCSDRRPILHPSYTRSLFRHH